MLLLSPGAFAQQAGHAFVNFNVDSSTLLPSSKYQKVTMFGCNTVVTIDTNYPGVPKGPRWKKAYQVYPGIPYGKKKDAAGKPYHVSKYYLASPPVMNKLPNNDSIYDIGLVTPDVFELLGEKPVQLVYLDYTILKPMFIRYLPVEFDSTFKNGQDSLVPFRVECTNFPWRDTVTLPGAQGASGIGYLSSMPSLKGRLFLPYYYEKDSSKVYLNTRVSILNDILLNYEVFFKVHNVMRTYIDLQDYKDGRTEIQLSRIPRKKSDIPCGCRRPEKIKECCKDNNN